MKKQAAKKIAKEQPKAAVRYHEAQIRRALDEIAGNLGGTDAKSLAQIAHLFVEDDANLGACAAILFPQFAPHPKDNAKTLKTKAAALVKAFNSFRDRVSAKSQGTAFPLAFMVDTAKRSVPDQRRCWISGTPPPLPIGQAISKAHNASPAHIPTDLPSTPNPAIDVTGEALGKPMFGWATIHASGAPDQRLADELSAALDIHLRACGTMVFRRVAEDRRKAQIIVPLLSPGFCVDAEKVEYTDSFIGPTSGHILVPVRLRELDETQDCGLVGQLQHFRVGDGPLPYQACTTAKAKEAFILALYKTIVQRAAEALETGRAPSLIIEPRAKQRKPEDGKHADALLDVFADRLLGKSPLGHRIDITGTISNPCTLTMGAAMPTDPSDMASEGDARDLLLNWLHDPKAPAFCAVLGEYGIGKTTSLRRFAHRVKELHQEDSQHPQAIFIDLREYLEVSENADAAQQAQVRSKPQSLESILSRAIHLNWRQADKARLTPEDILRAVRSRGAVLIFDGLDERIVHMDSAAAHAFIRELWRALPDPVKGEQRGRLIISCRSHYFRTVTQQLGFFSGNFREDLKPEDFQRERSSTSTRDFRAILLLPFGDNEVRSYLGTVAGMTSERVEQTLELIGRIHNLTELSKRPVLLSFIVQLLAQLEQRQMQGRTVHAASLYTDIVAQWLARDEPKHRVKPDHKIEIMEHLAAILWRSGRKEWTVKEAEDWLSDLLDTHLTHVRSRLRDDEVKREIVEHDFRAATFIVGTGKDRFRFAHTSFLEYFLASYLVHALDGPLEKAIAAWDLLLPSRETLEFFGQLLAEEPEKLQTRVFALEDIISSTSPPIQTAKTLRRPAVLPPGHRARLAAFHYWALACEKSLPAPEPERVNLEGADLEEIRLPPNLSLAGANLRSARLNRAHLERVDLRDADLTGAELRQAVCIDVLADRIILEQADLGGLQGRGGSLRQARASTAKGHCEWTCVNLAEAALPSGLQTDSASGGRKKILKGNLATAILLANSGHQSSIKACAWSSDSQKILSKSVDNTVKIWNADTGRCLFDSPDLQDMDSACSSNSGDKKLLHSSGNQMLKLQKASEDSWQLNLPEFPEPIMDYAWSPNGQRLLSVSYDSTLNIWDAATGRNLLNLVGHMNSISACAWNHDGQKILYGLNDNTLKLLDSATGRCLLNLTGHKKSVTSCTWSPTGEKLLSGSIDHTLRLWDAVNGRCLLSLTGHKGSVRACAWSPDGQKLLSGSADQTLKVWDATTGRCILNLPCDEGLINACAWSPDSRRLLSALDDGTLKVWDAANGRCLFNLTDKGLLRACAWSPDGQKLLSGSNDPTLKVWDATTGRCIKHFTGHKEWVVACAWNLDGQKLLSASYDNTLKVWNAASGRCLHTLSDHTKCILACAWNSAPTTLKLPEERSYPAGTLVFSADEDSFRTWDALTGELLHTDYVLPEDQMVSLRGTKGFGSTQPEVDFRISSPEAWRFLGWQWTDPDTQQMRLLPADYFAPLPTAM